MTNETQCHFCGVEKSCVYVEKSGDNSPHWYCEDCLDLTRLDELHVLTVPLMEWLENNYHPHVKVIVESGKAELLEVMESSVLNQNKGDE